MTDAGTDTVTAHDRGNRAPSSFPHGVASFDPAHDSVLLWTRAPDAARVRWVVAHDLPGAAVAEGEADVPPDGDGCVTVEARGLAPATPYLYWFEVVAPRDGDPHRRVRSPVGRTRTLPDAGTEPFRLAVVCCSDVTTGHFAAYRAVADHEVDLVLHVGDYMYETAKGDVRAPEPAHDVVTLEDYRTRLARTRCDPDLRALHQRHPMVAVWDDHDIADNAWRHGAKAHDPERHGGWEARLHAAATAHHEWLPARRRDQDDPLTVWRSFTVGDLAELVVLDTRIAGRDRQVDDGPGPGADDPGRSLLGDAQRSWAHERMRDTTRPWCLLASQVVVNRMTLPVPAGDTLGELAPSGYAVIDGEALCTDEWDGYPAERRALAQAMHDRGRGAVVLSGDVHSAWAFEGPLAPGPEGELAGPPVGVELVAPCVSATPMGAHLPRGWRKLLGPLADSLPEAVWFDLERHGYLVVEVDRTTLRAHWYGVDSGDPAANPEHLASYLHRLDAPGRLERMTTRRGPRPAGRRRSRWRRVATVAVMVGMVGGLAVAAGALGAGRLASR